LSSPIFVKSLKGKAYIFYRQQGGNNNWGQTQILTASDASQDANFGMSVGITASNSFGARAIVGAHKAEPSSGGQTDEGQAYIFEFVSGSWIQASPILKAAGSPINSNDYFGFSVAISNNTAIVGTPYHDEPGSVDVGVAHIFERTGSLTWTHRKKLLHNGGLAGDKFGYSVAISNTTVAIGAVEHLKNGVDVKGAVFIYTGSGTNWTQQGNTLKGNCCFQGDGFGQSVSLDGDTLIVGAPYQNAGIITNQINDTGSAFIFKRTMNVWNQVRQINNTTATATDYFGQSVAVSGVRFLVGSPNSDIGANQNQGAAFAYSHSSPTVTNPLVSTAVQGSDYGYSVAVSGEYAAVGAPGENGLKGAVYIFRNIGGSWVFDQKLAGSVFSRFGHSIAISGNSIIIGAPFETISGNVQQGAAYIYWRGFSGSSPWQLAVNGYITGTNGRPDDNFGWSVGISCDQTAIVGAPRGSVTSANLREGVAFVFEQSGINWITQAKLNATSPQASGLFGESVGLSDNYVVVGSPNFSSLKGAAYFFNRTGSGWSSATVIGTGSQAGDRFGSSVAISSNLIAVGIPFKTFGSNTWQGATNVYQYNNGTFQSFATITAPNAQAGGRFGIRVGISGSNLIVGSLHKDDSPNIIGKAHRWSLVGSAWIPQFGGAAILQTQPGNGGDTYPVNVAIDENYAMAAYSPINGTGMQYMLGTAVVVTGTELKTQQKMNQ
jgi:hypothetical protein